MSILGSLESQILPTYAICTYLKFHFKSEAFFDKQ